MIADTVATAVLERLKTILPEGQRGKLLTQVYDGAAVMRGATGGDVYGRPHYVRCYSSADPDNAAGNIPHQR